MRRLLMGKLEEQGELTDEEILEIIDELILSKGREFLLTLHEKEALRKDLFYSVRKLDVLQELVEDNTVTEIMVNGYQNIFVERDGKIWKWEKTFTSEERLRDVIQQIAGKCNRVVNEQRPIVDARLDNGSRVNIVLPPVALDGPVLTIRRFPDEPITMDKLTEWGSITREGAEFLKKLVKAGYTILIGGGTSTGKTTFLNALSHYIPKEERIVTIEDNAEMQIQGIDNLVRMEAKAANLEESREITIGDLIKTALRMRPSRIIIGEVRGGEAGDFLNCLNTGHSGSLGSAHANSVRDMVGRLE
ncbi:MAG: CpaF family protein, partial [Clostridiales bacterium]|nr:CpaF family protein [Clostridiales bacterium]